MKENVTSKTVESGETIKKLFEDLANIQNGNLPQEHLDKIIPIPMRQKMTEAQKEAELFNERNYKEFEGCAGKNRYFGIINENHRLYGKNIIMVMTSEKSGSKMFYIGRNDLDYVGTIKIHGMTYSVNIRDLKWYIRPDGYVVTNFKGTTVRLHKFLTGLDTVDHINGIIYDNYRDNLRKASAWSNNQNKGNTTFGVAGVCLNYYSNKLFRYYCKYGNTLMFSGIHNEFLFAALNKAISDRILDRVHDEITDREALRIAQYSVKFTGLNAKIAKEIYDAFINISTGGDIREIMGTLKKKYGIVIESNGFIEEGRTLRKFRAKGLAYGTEYYSSKIPMIVAEADRYKDED